MASCSEEVLVGRYRELQIKALGKSTYDYIIDYLSKKRLYSPKAFMGTVDDWFKYSWLVIANTEPVINWVGKRVNELLDLGVPPDEITLMGKWVFDVKAKKGNRWVTVAHKDPVISAGLPYWVGFQQVANTSSVIWSCPGNPPSKWSTGGLCTACCPTNNLLGIYFAGGGKPPSSIQAGVGTNCCYSAVGYNMNSPTSSFNNTVDSTGTKNVSTWSITGTTTVSISGPYLILVLATNPGSNNTGVTGNSYANCNCVYCSPANACNVPSGFSSSVVLEVIYENLGTLSIASNTSISASVQLIIALASPG